MCSPDAPSTTDAAEIESEEAEAFAAAEVHDPTLLFIDFDLQSGQFPPEAFLNRRHQPVMPRVGIHQVPPRSSAKRAYSMPVYLP